jgi:hypothetical protein
MEASALAACLRLAGFFAVGALGSGDGAFAFFSRVDCRGLLTEGQGA